MNEFLNFFNQNGNAIMAMSSIAMLLVTIAYVIINSKMHREMYLSRRNTEAPDIALKLIKIQSGFYDLQIINYSANPLFNLKFSKFPDSSITKIGDNKNLGLLENGISYMAPYQEYSSFFLNYPEVVSKYGKNNLPELEFIYSFKDSNNKHYEKKIKIELSSIYNLTTFGLGKDIHIPLNKIADLLEEFLNRKNSFFK